MGRQRSMENPFMLLCQEVRSFWQQARQGEMDRRHTDRTLS